MIIETLHRQTRSLLTETIHQDARLSAADHLRFKTIAIKTGLAQTTSTKKNVDFLALGTMKDATKDVDIVVNNLMC